MKILNILFLSISLPFSQFSMANEFEEASPSFPVEAFQPDKEWTCFAFNPFRNTRSTRTIPREFKIVDGMPSESGYVFQYLNEGWYAFSSLGSPFYGTTEFRLHPSGDLLIRDSATKIVPNYGLNMSIESVAREYWGFLPEGLSVLSYYKCQLPQI